MAGVTAAVSVVIGHDVYGLMFCCFNEPCRPKDDFGLVLIAAVPVLIVIWIALISMIVAIAFGILIMHIFPFYFLGLITVGSSRRRN